MSVRPARNDGTTMDLAGLLGRSAWFTALPAEVRAWTASRLVEQDIPRGQTIAHQGEIPAYWFGVIEGLLKSSVTAGDGRTSSLSGILPGCWFGEGALLRGRPRHADFVALRDSRVALLALDDFAYLLQTQPGFKDFILAQINERLHYFMEQMAESRLLEVQAQVAHALCGLLHPLNNPLGLRHLRIWQDELATLASISRQRCNQALARMREHGWLRTDYGGLTILAAEPIARMARQGHLSGQSRRAAAPADAKR